MRKSWLIAIVAALLVASPALAQSADPEVKVTTKQGGIVVKKVIKNGKVVDEDVKTAVHRHGGPADDAAVRSRQRLVPEAHAEHRDVHRVR